MSTIAAPRRSVAYTVSDSLTMLRRNLVHAVRYPVILYLIAMPVVFLVLFVYVFGGTMGAGLVPGAPAAGSGEYLQYLLPGMLLVTLASGVSGPAISVSKDLTEGIIARFRTMDISRSAVLSGHVLGNLVQSVIAVVVVLGVGLLMGFRAPASVWGWLGAAGFLTLIGYALCWMGAAFGVFARGVESASNLPMPLLILPFLSSAFVPTESLPVWMQWFAEYQPFTPFTEVLRGLLFATPIAALDVWLSFGWIALIGVGGWLWARTTYERKTIR
ncbi:ABC transporter permease [Microbacterium sp. B2969]|uniref:Transport permease protein n=1 Tax=Microbacterium alkaliflavum TaxID=3248839 RepID=A0ABW7QA06_9MICO